ncbi:g6888 [Coccomyxa viridis]|uniref:G6888 protein n=1 Tax=Coccomyxa viridis TaxID=1274662 RepID=A0ABP1FWI6_9CHLO
MEEGAAQPASVSLGKGAWDCDLNVAIPPEKEVKQALWAGGIKRANKPADKSSTPGMARWGDLSLIYAGQIMDDEKQLQEYRVPKGCQACIAVETAKLHAEPDPDSAYWN